MRAFGEGAWAVRAEGVTDFDVAPDGTVWAAETAASAGRRGGWTTVDGEAVWDAAIQETPAWAFLGQPGRP